jgi:DNA-binding MarR family transcriptional regulator
MPDTFRKTHVSLSPKQQKIIDSIKDMGTTIFDILDTHTTGDTDRRLVDNAKNQLEIAIMLAVKVVTGP